LLTPTVYIIPATVWTIIESDVTIISACLIVSRPWLIKLYPAKLISTIRERTSTRKSSSKSSSRGQGRWQMFSSFKRLNETPPEVATVSMGTRFEFDVEKGMEMNDVHHKGEMF